MADFEPIAPYCLVRSLEEEEEEAEENYGPVMDNDEVEMCEIVECHEGCIYNPGQIVLVRAPAYHYAPRTKEGDLFVCAHDILAVEKPVD